MPENGSAEETSKLDIIDDTHDADSQIASALSRLKQEARQAMAPGFTSTRDVTEEFTAAAQRLGPGQLVKDDFFTLFEAVGALEIMDPKMDSGFVPEGDTFGPDFEPSSPLTAGEVIYVMDQLLCLEITWLDGYPLSQTVFTSLHIDRLLSPDKARKDSFYFGSEPAPTSQDDLLVHTVLRSYCVALIKCCELALNLVQSQHFYDEEDFVTHLYGQELLLGISAYAADDMVCKAISWIKKSGLPGDIIDALKARCRFRLNFLRTLLGDEKDWLDIDGRVQSIKKNHSLEIAVEEAFSEKVQRQLATSTPPRPMIKVSFDVACSKWTKLCEDMLATYRLTSTEITQSPHCLQRAVWAFAYRDPEPSTLARAQLQDILFTSNAVADQMPHYDLLLLDLRDVVLAGDPLVDPESFQIELPTDPRHICSGIMQSFLEKAIEEYLNFYRMVCQNRCRIRRTFTQAVAVLDTLQSEAESADEELKLHSASVKAQMKVSTYGPLLCWTKFHTLRILAWTVQLGFETEIYLPDELGKMYWLLSSFCASRTKLLDDMRRATKDRKKLLRDGGRSAACDASLVFLNSSADWSQATRYVADALAKFYYLLTRVKIIKPPKRDFASSERLYEARMKPYLAAVNGYVENDLPGPESYEKACGAMDEQPLSEVAKAIEENIKKAKVALEALKKYTPEQGKFVGTEEEWKREIKATETTCVATLVGVAQLLRLGEKFGREDEDLGNVVEGRWVGKYHVWWIIPVLKERFGK